MRRIQIFEVPSEIGAGTRGASLGIEAIKIAAINSGSSFFSDHESIKIPVENDMLFEETDTPYARRIEGVVKIYDRVCEAISRHLTTSWNFPLILAGDHSTAGGTIAGIKKAWPNDRLGVIWIDAHADLHTPYTTPSGNMHGMPLAVCLGTDNRKWQVNEISEKSAEYWEMLKDIGGINPKIKPEDIVFISMRDYEQPEAEYIKEHQIRNYTVAEVREHGTEKIAQMALDHLKDCTAIYISFDVDSMDSDEVGEGTGTPVEKGLLPEECTDLLQWLLDDKRVACLEIVEVNPCLDCKNEMAETAFDILEEAIKEFELNNA
jgi:arginase